MKEEESDWKRLLLIVLRKRVAFLRRRKKAGTDTLACFGLPPSPPLLTKVTK